MKTGRRDAELLARLLMAGKLYPVRVPGDEEEALRDLVHAREAARAELIRSRHRRDALEREILGMLPTSPWTIQLGRRDHDYIRQASHSRERCRRAHPTLGQDPRGRLLARPDDRAVVAEHDQHKPIEIADADNHGAMLDMVSETEDRLKLIEKHS
jgi:transposase